MARRGDVITLPSGETAVIVSPHVLDTETTATHVVRVGDRGCDADGCQHADIRTVTVRLIESP